MAKFQCALALSLWLIEAHARLPLIDRADGPTPVGQAFGVAGESSLPPEPTPPPFVKAELFKRAGGQTCGYLEGEADRPFSCVGDDYVCVTHPDVLAVGCCPSTSTDCPDVRTTCLPYSSSLEASGANLSKTRYCSASSAPACAVGIFADPKWRGYTVQLCRDVSTTLFLYQSTFGGATTTMVSTETPTTTSTSTSSSSSSSSTSTGLPTETSQPSSTPAPPVGAIVGGVIGGIAVVALTVVGIFLLVRMKKTDPGPAQPANVAAQPYETPKGFVAGGAAESRFSIAKPPMSPVSSTGYHEAHSVSVRSASPPQNLAPFYHQSIAGVAPGTAQAYPSQQWTGQTPATELPEARR